MGPLKVIFDGSLNTRTAWCCAPYSGSTSTGTVNLSPDELTDLCRRAHAGGLEVAVHAIGDAAVTAALDAVEGSGARGSLEHVQLVADADLPRFAALGVRASVQPAHLLDDRDVTAALWPDRQARSFALRSLLDAGADLRLGSDAPGRAARPVAGHGGRRPPLRRRAGAVDAGAGADAGGGARRQHRRPADAHPRHPGRSRAARRRPARSRGRHGGRGQGSCARCRSR